MVIRLNWGSGIAVVYTLFAVTTMGFVAFALGRSVDLVTPDYYAQSLRQDGRMEAARNASELRPAPAILQTGDRQVLLALSPEAAEGARGTITLYRASDARADRVLALALDAGGQQQVSLAGMPAGHWLVQLQWSAAGRDYYLEGPVFAR